MNAIILCAGKGKRLENCIKSNKCLATINGKPLIELKIYDILNLDVFNKILIVVNYESDKVINNVESSYKTGKIHFIYQRKLNGIVGALKYAIYDLAGEDFMLFLGDEYFLNPKYKHMINYYHQCNADVVLGVVYTCNKEKIKKTYSIHREKDSVIKVTEKPLIIENNIMGTGVVIFKSKVLSYLHEVERNDIRNEYELADFINIIINNKNSVKIFSVSDKYINLNDKTDLEEMLILNI